MKFFVSLNEILYATPSVVIILDIGKKSGLQSYRHQWEIVVLVAPGLKHGRL